MQKKRIIIALTGAIIFGLIATLSVTRYVSSIEAHSQIMGSVVVAKTDIPLGTKLTVEQLDLVPIPNGSKPEGSSDSLDKVVGRIAIMPIGVREPVTSVKLAPEGAAGGLSAAIPEGFRAMTVSVNDIVGVSGFIMPGSFVDVVCIITPLDQRSAQGPISKIVLQNIKILANGTNIDQPKDGREANSNVRAVTLQVTPDQAERLAMASSEGRLQLVMRNYGDQEDAHTQGITKTALLNGESAAATPNPYVSAPQPPSSQARRLPVTLRYRPPVVPREEAKLNTPVASHPQGVISRSSVEVIEGAKKRNVDLP